MQGAGILDPYAFHTSLLDEFQNVAVAVYGFTGQAEPVAVMPGPQPVYVPGADPLAADLKRFTRPTRNARTLNTAMDAVLTLRDSNTPLFASIADTVRDVAALGRQAARLLVVFSDGMSMTPNNADLALVETARQEALRHGVSIYPVLVQQPMMQQYATLSSAHSMGAFEQLGPATGGRAFIHTASASVVPNILRSLAKEVLPFLYVAGYYPDSTGKNKRREAKVLLRNPDRGTISGGARIVVR
jgi:hypothetical protein